MPRSTFVSKVKKMDITNKVVGNHWKQMIGITLGEIALNDENLLAIRKFRPDEEVLITIEPLQIDVLEELDRIKRYHPTEGEILPLKDVLGAMEEESTINIEDDEEDEEVFEIEVLEEGKEDQLKEGEAVLRCFEF